MNLTLSTHVATIVGALGCYAIVIVGTLRRIWSNGLSLHNCARDWALLALGTLALREIGCPESTWLLAGMGLHSLLVYNTKRLAAYAGMARSLFAGLALFALVCVLLQAGKGGGYFYRGIPRHTGPFDNPNNFGALLAAALVVVICFAARELGVNLERRGKLASFGPSGLWCVLVLIIGVSLQKTYSRGAWIAFMAGAAGAVTIGYRQCAASDEPVLSAAAASVVQCGRLVMSLICSLVAFAALHFRSADSLVIQRLLSPFDATDLSWVNRVHAWYGGTKMALDNPLAGVGWDRVEMMYGAFYAPADVNGPGAIGTNDYIALACGLGLPALLCFLVYMMCAVGASWHAPAAVHMEPRSEGSRIGMRGVFAGMCHMGDSEVVAAGVNVTLLVAAVFNGILFTTALGVLMWASASLMLDEQAGARLLRR